VSEDTAIATGSVRDREKPIGDERAREKAITSGSIVASGDRARGTGRSQEEERKQPSVSLMGHPALHDWTVSQTDIDSAPTHSREIRGDPRFQLAPFGGLREQAPQRRNDGERERRGSY